MLDSEFVLFDQGPVSNKVEYILEHVYPDSRNPGNWLEFEFKYRQVLNSQIKFAHSDMSPGWENRLSQFDSDYNIFSYPKNSEIGYYYHVRLLPEFSKECYTREVSVERHQVEQYTKQYPSLLIDTEKFFKPTLDRELYTSVCNFGKFENHYRRANLIHHAWWTARNNFPAVDSIKPEPLIWPYVVSEIT